MLARAESVGRNSEERAWLMLLLLLLLLLLLMMMLMLMLPGWLCSVSNSLILTSDDFTSCSVLYVGPGAEMESLPGVINNG